MFKKVVLVLALVLALVLPSLACTLPAGTLVFLFTPQGMLKAMVPLDQEVSVLPEQPTPDRLKFFGDNNPGIGDWTDGIAVHDSDDNITILVHEKDLKCETGGDNV